MTYRSDLDGVRAIAILLVLAGHLVPEWVPGGYTGVDVFFVLSGFLITEIARSKDREGSFSLMSFYSARIRRLMPALLLVLAAVLVAGWFFLLPLEYRSLARHARASIGFFENYQLAREAGYFDEAVALKPLAHLWSLSIEEQFYLLFPGLIWLSRGRRGPFWVFILLLISVLTMLWLSEGAASPRAYLDPLARVWALLAGSGLSVAIQGGRARGSRQRQRVFGMTGGLGLWLVLGSALLLQPSQHYPGWRALGPVMGSLLLIGWGRENLWVRRFLEHPLPGYLGKISYPLYLWHWSLISFCGLLIGLDLGASERAYIFLASLCLSIFTFHAVERPLRASSAKARISILLVIGAVLLLAATQKIIDQKGIPSRVPDFVRFEFESFPEVWRVGHCLLTGRQSPAALDAACLAPPAHPRVLLWGDSFAAHLVPGVGQSLEPSAGLSVMSMMACFPGPTEESAHVPQCPLFYEAVMTEIRRHPYDRVILAANWEKYPRQWLFERVRITIERLRALGVNEILLVGPPPRWQLPLPRLLFLGFLKEGLLPERLKDARQSATRVLDQQLEQQAGALNVEYLSIFNRFCAEDGCVARRGSAILSLDEEHLTPDAARWLFSAPALVFR